MTNPKDYRSHVPNELKTCPTCKGQKVVGGGVGPVPPSNCPSCSGGGTLASGTFEDEANDAISNLSDELGGMAYQAGEADSTYSSASIEVEALRTITTAHTHHAIQMVVEELKNARHKLAVHYTDKPGSLVYETFEHVIAHYESLLKEKTQ